MLPFTNKKLPLEETVGEKLRQARQRLNLKLEQVAEKINIRTEYLAALEAENFAKLPSGLYGKKFLKKYATFLKLDLREDMQTNSRTPASRIETTSNPFSQKIVKKNSFIVLPKIIKNALVVSGVVACFLYLIFYFQKIITPPELTLIQPEKSTLTTSTAIMVSGQTEPESEIKINNQLILNDHKGYFSQVINLKKGLNILIISAKKKYSQEKIITREILAE
jgi:cytoskeletal protein RodZ